MSMKRSVHTESEMVKAVQELESGIDAETVARNHGISKATLYNWKSKYSGMEVSQVRRLKELEEENRKLKQMYAELALDNKILKDVIEKSSRARGKEGAGLMESQKTYDVTADRSLSPKCSRNGAKATLPFAVLTVKAEINALWAALPINPSNAIGGLSERARGRQHPVYDESTAKLMRRYSSR